MPVRQDRCCGSCNNDTDRRQPGPIGARVSAVKVGMTRAQECQGQITQAFKAAVVLWSAPRLGPHSDDAIFLNRLHPMTPDTCA